MSQKYDEYLENHRQAVKKAYQMCIRDRGDIDRGYYNNMVDEAVKSLSVYGDFERFAADEPYVSDNTPPWFGAGEPHEDDTTPFDVR